MKLQSLSSCGDIAVSVYSGWLAYSTFDHDWVKQQMEETSVNDVLKKLARLTYRTFTSSRKYGSPYWMDWVPSFFSTLSEWSQTFKIRSKFLWWFLDQSHACVESLIQAFKTNNIKGVQKMIRINRRIIQSMDNEASVEIETDKLKNYVMSVKSTVALLKLQVLVVAIAALLLSIR